MKKLVMLIFSVLFVSHVYAQDVDTVQVQSAPITIDSLVIRLDKLQHDYNFMSCEYELFKLKSGMDGLTQDINIKTNELVVDVHHSRFNKELYYSFCDYYDVCSSLYNSMKEQYVSVKKLVLAKALITNFTNEEISVIESYIDSINNSVALVESALKYLDYTIENYKKKR